MAIPAVPGRPWSIVTHVARRSPHLSQRTSPSHSTTMTQRDNTHPSVEAAVKACYSTWSSRYYEDYYGAGAAYPPVHRELLKRLLREHGARSVLDAGCGPASFLRELGGQGLDLYGFDLTPEMVAEARRVLAEQGVA